MSLSMVRSASSSSPFLTRRSPPILMVGIFFRSMGLQADVFDTRRYSATCGTSMRPSGRSYVSDVEEATDSRISAAAFSRLTASLSNIPKGVGNASRVIWRMSSLMGWPTSSSSCIWCVWVVTRPKEPRSVFAGKLRDT